jgi:hypothetical protein
VKKKQHPCFSLNEIGREEALQAASNEKEFKKKRLLERGINTVVRRNAQGCNAVKLIKNFFIQISILLKKQQKKENFLKIHKTAKV